MHPPPVEDASSPRPMAPPASSAHYEAEAAAAAQPTTSSSFHPSMKTAEQLSHLRQAAAMGEIQVQSDQSDALLAKLKQIYPQTSALAFHGAGGGATSSRASLTGGGFGLQTPRTSELGGTSTASGTSAADDAIAVVSALGGGGGGIAAAGDHPSQVRLFQPPKQQPVLFLGSLGNGNNVGGLSVAPTGPRTLDLGNFPGSQQQQQQQLPMLALGAGGGGGGLLSQALIGVPVVSDGQQSSVPSWLMELAQQQQQQQQQQAAVAAYLQAQQQQQQQGQQQPLGGGGAASLTTEQLLALVRMSNVPM